LQGCFTCGQIEFLVFEIGLKKKNKCILCVPVGMLLLVGLVSRTEPTLQHCNTLVFCLRLVKRSTRCNTLQQCVAGGSYLGVLVDTLFALAPLLQRVAACCSVFLIRMTRCHSFCPCPL